MDRRRFLSLSAISLAVTACGGGGSSSSPIKNTPAPIVPPVASNISDDQWQALKSSLNGELILADNSTTYHDARLGFNTRFDHILPEAIVKCESEQDVISTLSFVRDNSLAVTPRCGSHSYAGYSNTTGIVIDVTPLSNITVEQGTATIGAGARLVDVYDQLTAQGVAIPIGSCLSVGIAGLTLGGGIGVVDRAYGLTCDNLLSAKMVTADGELITCSESQHSDLFWALRGGGGGNFGVVTEFTFKTHTTRDISVFEAYYNFDDFVEVMSQWQLLSQAWPNDMWCQIIPDWTRGSPTIYIRAFCLNSQEEATVYWDDFIASINATPTSNRVTTDTYRNVMMGTCSETVAACHLSNQFESGRMSRSAFGASSDYFDQLLPEVALTTLKSFIENSVQDNNYGMLIINTMGGVIDNFSSTDTAFVHRNALFSVEYYAPLNNSVSNSRIDETQAWQNSFRGVMSPWTTGGAYVNYIDPLIVDWQYAYYGDNYTKLQAEFKDSPEKIALWQNIKQGYEYFENLRKLPQVTVDRQGLYHFK